MSTDRYVSLVQAARAKVREMTPQQLRHRLLMYQDEYLETEGQAQDVVEHLCETEEARSLLRRFLELYT